MLCSLLLIVLFFVSGKELQGLWHTGIVAYGREYFFGGMGIESCRAVSCIVSELGLHRTNLLPPRVALIWANQTRDSFSGGHRFRITCSKSTSSRWENTNTSLYLSACSVCSNLTSAIF